MVIIEFPVSDYTIDDIDESARKWKVKKDAIMRAAVDQALNDGLNQHFFEVLQKNRITDRVVARLDDDAYSEVSILAKELGTSRAAYTAACILQSMSRGLIGSYVEDATYDLGRPRENDIEDENPLWGKRQPELWGIWREWQRANGEDEEEDAMMLMHA